MRIVVMGVRRIIGSEVIGPIGRIIAVDHAGRARSIKGGAGSDCRVADRRHRRSNKLNPPRDLRPRNAHNGLTDVVSIWAVGSNEMIVFEIHLTKQAIAARTRVYSVVHGNARKLQNRSDPFSSYPVPGIAAGIIVKWVHSHAGRQIVAPK